MDNLMAFLNSFASYLLVFFVFAAAIVGSFMAGRAVRLSKNKKEEAAKAAESKEE